MAHLLYCLLITVWAKFLGAPEISYLIFFYLSLYLDIIYAMDYWVLNYHSQDVNPWKYMVLFFGDSVGFYLLLPSVPHKQ